MIYSASRRTDMPAFFPDALADRVSRSRKLEAMVLWTKDPRNLVDHPRLRRAMSAVPVVVQLTVTGLAETQWEPRVPHYSTFLRHLSALRSMLPRGAVRWRFDPVVFTPDLPERFVAVKAALESALGELDEVIVSFPDPYRHAVARTEKAGASWPILSVAEKKAIIAMMAGQFAEERDSRPVKLCCEPELLALRGVGQARCIDGELFEKLYGLPLGGLGKDAGQRVACGCVASTDIGSYDMRCRHGCLYCYARPDES